MLDQKEEPVSEVLLKYYPGGFFGHDRDGRPVFIEPLGKIDFQGLLHSIKPEEIVNFKRKHCEDAKELCKRQEEKLAKNLETYSTLILDGEGGGRKHLWKPGLQNYQTVVRMYENEFPNLRKHIIVINTPAIFPIVFALIKPLLKESTREKIKVLGSNWREELQNYVSPENLPEHYGGLRTDKNGNPRCEEFICYGGEVPESYYITRNVNKENFELTTVKAGGKFAYELDILDVNRKIKYQFVTSDYDIGFSVDLLDGDDVINIVPETKTASHIIMEEGVVDCKTPGKYRFTFDNTFSWLRPKELFYMIKIAEN